MCVNRALIAKRIRGENIQSHCFAVFYDQYLVPVLCTGSSAKRRHYCQFGRYFTEYGSTEECVQFKTKITAQ